jgi:hypothetical protein
MVWVMMNAKEIASRRVASIVDHSLAISASQGHHPIFRVPVSDPTIP